MMKFLPECSLAEAGLGTRRVTASSGLPGWGLDLTFSSGFPISSPGPIPVSVGQALNLEQDPSYFTLLSGCVCRGEFHWASGFMCKCPGGCGL